MILSKHVREMFVYLFIYLGLLRNKSTIYQVFATVSVIDKGILPLEKGSVGIQFYIDAENTDRMRHYQVRCKTDVCCLTKDKESDCDTMSVHGVNSAVLEPQDRKTFVFVYPTLIEYDQVGYCNFVIDYEYGNRQKRNVAVNVAFDTRLASAKKQQHMKAFRNEPTSCCNSLDEDSLNKCNQVNCDLKYLGQKAFFDIDTQNCVRALVCFGDPSKELPDTVYVPQSNTCRELDKPLTLADIYAISTGLSVITEPTNNVEKTRVILKSNCSTISQNLFLLKDLMCGKLCPILNVDTSSYIECCTNAILSIISCIIALCALLFSLVCCIHSTVWLYIKWSKGDLKYCYQIIKKKFKKPNRPERHALRIENNLRNALLREVIVRDLPLDVRESIVDICERIGEEVKWKKRYRRNELGSQVNLRESESDSNEESTETSSHDDA